MRPPHKPISLAFLCSLLLTGCASPHYGLRPNPTPSQTCELSRNKGAIVTSPGQSTTIKAIAEVSDLLATTYILGFIDVTNCSTNTVDLSYDSFEILVSTPKGERPIKPVEPEALVKTLSKKRASRESGRAWGTIFAAMASGHQSGTYNGVTSDGTYYTGTYSSTDTGEQMRVMSAGMAANKLQTDQESELLRSVDTALIRPGKLEPSNRLVGLLVFPFTKSKTYRMRAHCGADTHEFTYQLREY